MGSPHKTKARTKVSKCCGCSCKRCVKGHNKGPRMHTQICWDRLMKRVEDVLKKKQEVD